MAKYRKYDTTNFKNALNDVKRGVPIRRAAVKYNVPHMTLKRHAHGLNKGGQPVRVLTKDEEEYLVTYIKYSQERSLPLTRKMIKLFASQLVKRSGRESPIGPNGPSDKWVKKFLGRHPELHMRKPQTIDGGRVRMANPTVMSQYFSLLKQTVDKLGLEDKPNLIYNMDETGFGKGVVAQDKVCVTNGGAYTRQVSTATHTTAVVCVSGDGKVLPSMVIFEKSFPGGSYRDGIPEEWLFGISPNGYMDGELFIKWLDHIFLPHAAKQRPILLIMDNHESHLSLEAIEKARANRVELLSLPPHTTHLLQPLDVTLFRPLKKSVSDLSTTLGYANPNLIIGKGRFAQVLRSAIEQTFTLNRIKTAFRKCGIVPLDANAIDKSRLTPSDSDYAYPRPGPGGDNLDLAPLCDSCGQFVHGHPLVTQGLIPKELADIFVPIIGPVNKFKNTRIITKSRVLTGSEIYAQIKEKEMAKTSKPKAPKNAKQPKNKQANNEANTCEDDELPKMNPPKKRKRTKADKKKDHELDDEMYTCQLCQVRGHTNDEEEGIIWVGCDNIHCGLWFHRDCLSTDIQTVVDLSLITNSSWFCDICSAAEGTCQSHTDEGTCQSHTDEGTCQSHSDSQENEKRLETSEHDHETSLVPNAHQGSQFSNFFICQVCMAHEAASPIELELYWAICDYCQKSYHSVCLPPRRYRSYEMKMATRSAWCCEMCPAQ